YTEALLSTLRHYPMGEFSERYRRVGELGIPVTAIWGTEDKVVPYLGAEGMASDVPQLQLITLTGGDHNITYTRPHEVAAAILAALPADR
ncbi:MAG: alpha/beta hydrolase, partial [Pseudomonadota bacterium]